VRAPSAGARLSSDGRKLEDQTHEVEEAQIVDSHRAEFYDGQMNRPLSLCLLVLAVQQISLPRESPLTAQSGITLNRWLPEGIKR
jgi:hypothetical protein